jgi:hypothetical protein
MQIKSIEWNPLVVLLDEQADTWGSGLSEVAWGYPLVWLARSCPQRRTGSVATPRCPRYDMVNLHTPVCRAPQSVGRHRRELAVHEFIYASMLGLCLDPVYTSYAPSGQRPGMLSPMVASHWGPCMAEGEWHRQRGTSQCLGASSTIIRLDDVHKAALVQSL